MGEVINGWADFERALIYQRYSIRHPKTSERLEKTYEDVIERVSDFILKQKYPVSKDILFEALRRAKNREFTFATPVLMNLGNPYTRRCGFYSCFPLGPIPDSTKDILRYVEACASIFQYAGGVGLDFSTLRPEGSGVDQSQGVSSGPVGFIPMFEATSKSIAAGGKRRGAMLGQLDYNHPDIFKYVRLKRERRDLWSINISVNAFGDFWEQRELIKEIALGMWTSGDPGLLFPDVIADHSPYPPELKPHVRYVNPCVTGDTKVATELGEIPIAELAERFQRGEKIRVLNGNGNYTIPTRVWKTRENVEVVLVRLSNGRELKVTPDHSFYVTSEYNYGIICKTWTKEGQINLGKVPLVKRKASELNTSDCLIPEALIRSTRAHGRMSPPFCRVEKVEKQGKRYDVYNITEPETHKVFYNGILTANCGEYTSPPFSVCHLLTGNAISADSVGDFEALGYYMTHIGNAILYLTLEYDQGLPREPEWLYRKLRERIEQIHPVGVGLTGVAEYLFKKGYEYTDTDRIMEVYSALTRGSLIASNEWALATRTEKKWDSEYKKEHLSLIGYTKRSKKFWNTTTITQAPAGSVSQFLRCISTGLEPLEAFQVKRQFLNSDGEFQTVILKSQVTPSDPPPLPFIPPEKQIEVVSAVQQISHTSASKTINVPKETSVEEVEEIIFTAQRYRLKGLTVYRRGCVLDSIVEIDNEDEKREEDVLSGQTYKFKGLNNIYITINRSLRGKPIEVFVSTGKSGNVVNGLAMGLGRLVSLALRSGTKPEVIMKSLSGIETGDYYVNKRVGRVTSICDAVAKVLQDVVKTNTNIKPEDLFDLCPKCQNYSLVRNGQGCKSCSKCGYSTC